MHSTGSAPAGLRAPMRATRYHSTSAKSDELISHRALDTSVSAPSPMLSAGTSKRPASVSMNDRP